MDDLHDFKENSFILGNLLKECYGLKQEMTEFHYGTCRGIYYTRDKKIIINAIINDKPHNGDFELCMKHFEKMAREKRYDLVVAEIWNDELYNHFLKRDYKPFKKFNGLIKSWRNCDL